MMKIHTSTPPPLSQSQSLRFTIAHVRVLLVGVFSLFLSSALLHYNDFGLPVVESFSVDPGRTCRKHGLTGRNSLVTAEQRQLLPLQRSKSIDRSTMFWLMAAPPRTTNETSETSSTKSTSLLSPLEKPVDPVFIAETERAWVLESSPSSMQKSSNIKVSSLSYAGVIGPILSIGFVVGFLFYTLLHSGGISDTFLTMDLSHKLEVLGKISWFPGQVQEAQLVVGLVMAFSAFAQALTGFGFAVVAVGAMSSMPWLLHSELYDVITPVAATLGALVGFILLIPYAVTAGEDATEDEPGLEWEEILPLLIPCTALTPLGIQLNNMVDPIIATRVLAALIMGFVLYKLVPAMQDAMAGNDDEKESMGISTASVASKNGVNDDDEESSFLQSRTAAILFGSAAGIFGGAFDVQGPPLCIYGDAKGWSPARFRNNVLAVVCLNSAFVVAIDSFQGTLGDFYYSYFCITSLPGVLLGVIAGQYASERIDPDLFKNLVLVMCLALGVQLLTIS